MAATNKEGTTNTQIYLWLEPLVIDHAAGKGKVYFYCTIEGDHTNKDTEEIERILEGEIMQDIMDFAGIEVNKDYGIVSMVSTQKGPEILITDSPAQRLEAIRKVEREKKVKVLEQKKITSIAQILSGEKDLKLTAKNFDIKDGGMIEVKIKSAYINEKIDFADIWLSLEKHVIGKIKEGDNVILKDHDGNILFEMHGGNYLNVGLADLQVYDRKKHEEDNGIFGKMRAIKGGLFIREDGSMDIGDNKRTFWLKINMANVIRASIKSNTSLMGVMKNYLPANTQTEPQKKDK